MLSILSVLFTLSAFASPAPPPHPYLTETKMAAPGHSGGYMNPHAASLASSAINGIFNPGPAATYDHIRHQADHASASAAQLKKQAEAIQSYNSRIAASSSSPAAVPVFDDLLSSFLSDVPPPPDPRINLSSIPDPREEDLPYRFTSNEGEFKSELKVVYKDLYKISPYYENRKQAKSFGLISVEQADIAFAAGEVPDAEFYKDMAKGFLDIAVGLDPVSGMARSGYELLVGRNLITGAKLTSTERGFAFFGVMTLGGSKYLTVAGRGMSRIYEGAARILSHPAEFRDAIRAGETIAARCGSVLSNWSRKHRITSIEPASVLNERFRSRLPSHRTFNPPYKGGSHIINFTTTHDDIFVRVSTESNRLGGWLVRRGEIKGLTPVQIQTKLNLEFIPTHIGEVHIPSNVQMSRGATNGNHWESLSSVVDGNVQYRIESIYEESWFQARKLIGDRYL